MESTRESFWARGVITWTHTRKSQSHVGSYNEIKAQLRTRRFTVERDNNIIQWAARGMCYWDETGCLENFKVKFMEPVNKSHDRHTMNSTTLMPKCSSTMVLRPMLAFDSHDSISG